MRKLLLFSFFLISAFSNAQFNEKIDRGIVALSVSENTIYVGWRFLIDDQENIAFNIYRKDIGLADYERINSIPVSGSTNYLDSTVIRGHGYIYIIKTIVSKKQVEPQGEAYVFALSADKPWYSIKLNDDISLKRVGIGDLEGDGAYDFVIQHPNFNVGPYYRTGYWKRSPEPYKLDAYSSKDKFLWRYNIRWSIESVTWYSPYMVYDIDLDGKAEIYAKAGEGDPRQSDGHVLDGPEYMVKLNRHYRLGVADASMGYFYPPQLGIE